MGNKKWFLMDLLLRHINMLKEINLWWSKDEELFKEKYGISSDEANKTIREKK